ncbi:MAG TPA: single-stranded DNA-binding protein [Bryobacteraceae bacterium]|jgi:single-strand DNA-binding protein
MANRSVNKVILLGNLGKDAETKFTPSGTAVSNFTLATSRRWKDQQTGDWKEETEWHRCVLWRSENLSNYLQKGKQVYIEGRLQTRSWEDKDHQKRYTTEVVCDELILLGNRGGDAPSDPGGEYERPVSMPRSAQQHRPQPAASAPPAEDFNQGITDDDVPF